MIEIRVNIYLNYLKSKGKKALNVYEKNILGPGPEGTDVRSSLIFFKFGKVKFEKMCFKTMKS